jgi:hypothetical protein
VAESDLRSRSLATDAVWVARAGRPLTSGYRVVRKIPRTLVTLMALMNDEPSERDEPHGGGWPDG